MAGCAAVRHHRDGGGIGLQPPAKACIRAARHAASLVPFWEITPHQELLKDRENDEAYLAARPGEQYVLYFTDGGSVGLDLTRHTGRFRITWINIAAGRTGGQETAFNSDVQVQGRKHLRGRGFGG